MARKGQGGEGPTPRGGEKGEGRADRGSYADVMMGDIRTAASGSMGPHDFSQGYGPNEGELLNQNFSTKNNRNSSPSKEGGLK